MSGAIVSCSFSLLACLAPATINPALVVQELQVTVATVTVVQPDPHHYSSNELPWWLPLLSIAEAAEGLRVQMRKGPRMWRVCLSVWCKDMLFIWPVLIPC